MSLWNSRLPLNALQSPAFYCGSWTPILVIIHRRCAFGGLRRMSSYAVKTKAIKAREMLPPFSEVPPLLISPVCVCVCVCVGLCVNLWTTCPVFKCYSYCIYPETVQCAIYAGFCTDSPIHSQKFRCLITDSKKKKKHTNTDLLVIVCNAYHSSCAPCK